MSSPLLNNINKRSNYTVNLDTTVCQKYRIARLSKQAFKKKSSLVYVFSL